MQKIRKCLGIDIGATTVKIAEVSVEKTGLKVTKLISQPHEGGAGVFDDARTAAVSTAIKAAIKEARISTKQAVFSLPGQSVFIRQITVPRTSEERLRRMVAFEARQQIPFALENSVMEYQVFDTGDPNEVKVLLAAVKKDLIDDYMKVVAKSGLKPILISVSSLALLNFHIADSSTLDAIQDEIAGTIKPTKVDGQEAAADAEKEAEEVAQGKGLQGLLSKLNIGKKKSATKAAAEALTGEGILEGDDSSAAIEDVYEEVRAFVNIGAQTFDLVIARYGKQKLLGFPRSVPWGGNELSRLLMEKVPIENVEEAERVKRSKAIIVVPGREHEVSERNADVDASEFTTTWADRLILDLRKSFDYYISQPDGLAVDNIVLSGGTSALPNLADYIEDKLGIPVTVKQSFENAAVEAADSNTPANEISAGLIAVGLAVSGLNYGKVQVDFLPSELKSLREFKKKNVALFFMIGTLAAMVAVGTQVGSASKNEMTSWVDQQQGTIDKADTVARQIAELDAQTAKVVAKLDSIRDGGSDRSHVLEFLAVVEGAKPADVTITSLYVAPNGEFSITAESASASAVTNFLTNLGKQTDWVEKRPTLISNDQRLSVFTGRPAQAFSLSAKLKGKTTRLDSSRATLDPGLLAPTPTPAAPTQGGMMPGGRPGMAGGGEPPVI